MKQQTKSEIFTYIHHGLLNPWDQEYHDDIEGNSYNNPHGNSTELQKDFLIDLESARIPKIPEPVKTIANESEIKITREIDIVEHALSAVSIAAIIIGGIGVPILLFILAVVNS